MSFESIVAAHSGVGHIPIEQSDHTEIGMMHAEGIPQQGRPGVVFCYWRINGSEVPSLVPYFAWALRQQVVSDYFSAGQPPQPLPGSKAPNNFPPGKFKPPVLTPGECIPQLGDFIPVLIKSMWTTCAQTVLENSAVAVLLEVRVLNALVGPGVVAGQIRSLAHRQRTYCGRIAA